MDSSQRLLNSRNSYYVDISRAKWDVKIVCDDLPKIKEAVKDFAVKLTSNDFKEPKTGNSIKLTFDDVKQSFKDSMARINDSIRHWQAKQKSLGVSDLIKRENTVRVYEKKLDSIGLDSANKPKGPTLNR